MSFRSFVCVTLLVPFVAAYRDTVPVVAWSSHKSPKLDSLAARPNPFSDSSQFFDTLLNEASLCDFGAIIIADQPGLHASDLRSIDSSSYVSQSLRNAKSSLQIPYLPEAGDSDFLEAFKSAVAERCAARRLELELGQGGVTLRPGEKHLISLSMPSMEGPVERKQTMSQCHKNLRNDVNHVTSLFSSYLVIYTSSRPFVKRQQIMSSNDAIFDEIVDFDTVPAIAPVSKIQSGFAPLNTTLVKGSLTQRFQFFTPGLITALLLVFGVLAPILMFGIYSLASIQSPLRMDAKGPSLEKKNQ